MKARSGRNALSGRTGDKVSTHPGGRVCAQDACSTVLSKYNGSEFCSVHEPRTRRTGSRL